MREDGLHIAFDGVSVLDGLEFTVLTTSAFSSLLICAL